MRNRDDTKIVLGLSALAHDPAAALFVEGRLLSAVEEERLTRQKNTTAFPFNAIRMLLKNAGLHFHDVGSIAYYWNDRRYVLNAFLGALWEGKKNAVSALRLAVSRLNSYAGPTLLKEQLSLLCKGNIGDLPYIHYVDHHKAHIMSGILSAPFDPDSALVIDGRGEYLSTSFYRVTKDRNGYAVKLADRHSYPNSLGIYYGAITQLLGEQALSDEYKVMGLASYGRYSGYWEAKVGKILRSKPDGKYKIDASYFDLMNSTNPYRTWFTPQAAEFLRGEFKQNGSFTAAAEDLAYAAQQLLEKVVTEYIQRVVRKYGIKNLVISGGVAMNAKLIGRIREQNIVEHIHVPLAPTDAGACIGAAAAVVQQKYGNGIDKNDLLTPYLGPSYSDGEIRDTLEKALCSYEKPAEFEKVIARDIAAGRVVGWFEGRMEFGARALGARSILGDPRRIQMRDRINQAVKKREAYRPFAPAVLEEKSEEYFMTGRSRLMGEIVYATRKAKETVPAVVHIDGTARPQTVPSDCANGSFRKLIESYQQETGIPLVINTSFNVKGEPIVCSPEDALKCFFTSGIEVLCLEGHIVRKKKEIRE